MLSPSAFWPRLHLHSHSKMPSYLHHLQTEDVDISVALSSWRSLSNSDQPHQQSRAVQKAWDGIIDSVVQASLLSIAESPLHRARLLSACAEHSGD